MKILTHVIPQCLQVLDQRLLLVRAHAGEHGAAHSHAVRHLRKVAAHHSEALAVDGEVVAALLHVQGDVLQGTATRALVPPVINGIQDLAFQIIH